MPKDTHQPGRILAKHAGPSRPNAILDKLETVHKIRGRSAPLPRHPGRQRARPGHRHEAKPLPNAAGQQIDRSSVSIVVAHETLDPPAVRTLRIAKAPRHGRLDALGESIRRPPRLVMRFVPHPQQKIVGAFEVTTLRLRDQAPSFQLRKRAAPVLEERQPEQTLKIPESAASALDVRLLQADGAPELGPPRLPVCLPRGDERLRLALDTPGGKNLLELGEQPGVPSDEPRIEQCGLCPQIPIRGLNRPGHRLRDWPHPPEQTGQIGRLDPLDHRPPSSRCRCPIVAQNKKLDVAGRIQIATPIAAHGRHGEG